VLGLKKNHALLEVSSSLRVGEVRVRVRDFLSGWQELQDEKKVEKKEDKKSLDDIEKENAPK
jgi:hypothetical protein